MLSPSDAKVAQRDPALPGLATLLDGERFLEVLRPRYPDLELFAAERTYLRYKPATNCLVAFRVSAGDDTFEVYAKAHRADAVEKLAKGAMRAVGRPVGGLFTADPSLVVCIFPTDSKLRVLERLADSDERHRLLNKVFDNHPEYWNGTLCPLRYKPERRFVARWDVPEGPSAVVKVYTEQGYREAGRTLTRIRSRDVLRVCRRLGTSSAHGIVAAEWLPGRVLSECLCEPDFDLASLEAVGVALAELHQQDPKQLALASRSEEVAGIAALAELLEVLTPSLGRRARDLAGRLIARLSVESFGWRTLHGDFYAKQVLVGGSQVGVVDFDACKRGDPGADLGLFLAHLERDVLRGRIASTRLEALQAAFLRGYRLARGADAAVELHTAIGLFGLIHNPFRHAEADWPAGIEAILDRAESLEGALPSRTRSGGPLPASPTPAPVTDPFDIGSDAGMPNLAAALDAEEVSRQLACFVYPDRAVRVCAIRVLRHLPGRRCLIEYDIEVAGDDGPVTSTLIGKARKDRVDFRTYHLSQALCQSGLGPESESGIGVAEPLGVLPELFMWLQRKAQGQLAEELLLETDPPELPRRIARAAHLMHAAAVPCHRRHTLADELRILDERLTVVAEEMTPLATRLQALREGCHALARSIPETPPAGIHRDFYPKQILVGERLTIVDLDLFCAGDPALDIGNFAGHLIELGVRHPEAAERLERHRLALEESYLELAGANRRRAVAAYTTLTLARHVQISRRLAHRRPFTETILRRAEERLVANQ